MTIYRKNAFVPEKPLFKDQFPKLYSSLCDIRNVITGSVIVGCVGLFFTVGLYYIGKLSSSFLGIKKPADITTAEHYIINWGGGFLFLFACAGCVMLLAWANEIGRDIYKAKRK